MSAENKEIATGVLKNTPLETIESLDDYVLLVMSGEERGERRWVEVGASSARRLLRHSDSQKWLIPGFLRNLAEEIIEKHRQEADTFDQEFGHTFPENTIIGEE